MKHVQSMLAGAMMLGVGACQPVGSISLNAAQAGKPMPAPATPLTQAQLLHSFAHVWTGLEIVQGLGDSHSLASRGTPCKAGGAAGYAARTQSLSYCIPSAASGNVYLGEYAVQDLATHTQGINVSKAARLNFDGKAMMFNTKAGSGSNTQSPGLRTVFDGGTVLGDTAFTALGAVVSLNGGSVRAVNGQHSYQLSEFNAALSDKGNVRRLSRGVSLSKMFAIHVGAQHYSVIQVQPVEWQAARFPVAGSLKVEGGLAECQGYFGIVFKPNQQLEVRCGAAVFYPTWTDSAVVAALKAVRK